MPLLVRRKQFALPISAALLAPALLVTAPCLAVSKTGIPPTAELVVAPAPAETVYYRVPFSWQGADLDGTVSLYRIALDPPAFGEPYWIETSSTSRTFFFEAGSLDLPVPDSGPVTFSQPHTLVLKAVDDEGLESEPVSRSFFASTIAPEVQIVAPKPDPTTSVPIGTQVTIEWQGTDLDGVFTNRPVRYKYLLVGQLNDFPGGIDGAWAHPEAFRDRYAPLFADWSTTSSDTTSAHFFNLVPGQRYLFCVVGFDEAGAYSARFGPAINMIELLAGITPTRAASWGRLKWRYR